MNRAIVLSLLVVVGVFACEKDPATPHATSTANATSSTNDGCSPEACRALRQCDIRFEAGPRTVLCKAALKLDKIPDDFDETPYCVAACKRMKGGRIAKCMLEKARCENQPHGPEEFGCEGSTGEEDAEDHCADACAHAKHDCDFACPTTSFAGCMECSNRCGAAWMACWNACPRQPDAGT